MTDAFRHARLLANEAETRQLAMDLAMAVQPNDVVTLEGDLGAGKSTLARALIRAIAEDDMLEVPSPTFAIVQPYDLARLPVVHADLYRLTSPDEIAEIGWDEVSDRALLIVEWPDRLDGALSGDRLEIILTLAPGRGPMPATPSSSATAPGARGWSASWRCAASSTMPAGAARCAGTCRGTPPRAPTSACSTASAAPC